ncbi:transcriptional regulator TrmB [Haladaptatus sp. R4]|uniref:TrmB family transcriptional regulator n=1 Tax=Haladaptatus sp. R4 TaxID=1679489 RepID=UPI0007B4D972|nr:TrmB family transcriptional regulator [Haladaptatus sp. R4]KZN26406.1 transcriptional regulator TrmB [Haladaptatus sp. R4]
MDDDRLREALEEAELTAYQSDAYVTLLEQGMASAVEVAHQCSVPVSQIYDVLRALEQKGYIETLEQDTLHARPKDPVSILQKLRSRGQMMDEAADAIEDRWRRPSLSSHMVSVVKHEDTVIDRARDLIRDAESFIQLSVTVEQFEALTNALQDARKRDVVVRATVYPDGGSDDWLTAIDLEKTLSELRVCHIPAFLTIVDRTMTCFTPNDWANRPFGVLIDDYILSFIFHWYFQTCLWSLWDTVYVDSDVARVYMTLEEFVRDAVALQADGARITATVHGFWIDRNEDCEITGLVTDILYPTVHRSSTRPSYDELAGFVRVQMANEDGTYSIGSWGAVYEDIEAVRIVLEDIDYTSSWDGIPGR